MKKKKMTNVIKMKVEGGDDPEGNDPWGILTPSRNRFKVCSYANIFFLKGENRSLWPA